MIELMNQQGKTILLVEQNARAGLKLSSHGVVLENGTVRLTGSGREVLEHPEIGALYLGGAVTADAGAPRRADIVVAGAGSQQPDHRRLPDPGGLSLPGPRRPADRRRRRGLRGAAVAGLQLDSCSTGHTLIQTNPLLADDELGTDRRSRAWRTWRPTRSPTSSSPTVSRSPCGSTSIAPARRSRASHAPTRRPTAACWPTTTRSRTCSAPSASPRSAWVRASSSASTGARAPSAGAGGRAMSAWDVVNHDFQSRHVRAFMLWMAFQTGQPVGSPPAPGRSPTRSSSGASAAAGRSRAADRASSPERSWR